MPYVEDLTSTDINFGKVLWNEFRQSKEFPAQGVLSYLYEIR